MEKGKKQSITLMVIPHDGKAIRSIEINIIALLGIVIGGIVIIFGFIFSTYGFVNVNAELNQNRLYVKKQEENTRKSLESLQKTVDVSKKFSTELDKTSTLLGMPPKSATTKEKDGDFSKVFSASSNTSDITVAQPLTVLLSNLKDNIPILENFNKYLMSKKNLMRELPVSWPIPGAQVTMEWGPNIHPIYGSWYIHKGIDFAALTGTPIYSVADGVVIGAGYDPGHGLNVYVSHKYGFKTHYSHMSSIKVVKGQEVGQGQRLGNVGSTGLTTGPSLHFELYLGGELIDPGVYLRTFNTYSRPQGNR